MSGHQTSFSCVVVPCDDATPIETSVISSMDEWKELVKTALGIHVDVIPLLRPDTDCAGLFAFTELQSQLHQNIRATRLAFACGLLSLRFRGVVVLVRSNAFLTEEFRNIAACDCQSLTKEEVYGACCVSPDLRLTMQKDLVGRTSGEIVAPPTWLADASQHNYHHASSMARLSAVMTSSQNTFDSDEISRSSIASSSGSTSDLEKSKKTESNISSKDTEGNVLSPSAQDCELHLTARSSICLHCRGPTTALCSGCNGAYFCDEPRTCRLSGWSHMCLCSTWKHYCEHRSKLSTFPFHEWHSQLLRRDCQLSEQPYRNFLRINNIYSEDGWWSTESDGWSGGESKSASTIDVSIRRSFVDGFAPLKGIPSERRVTPEDVERCNQQPLLTDTNQLLVSSWEQYYELRDIPLSSPVALLLTFPLTLYYAIVKYGDVPITVARMLKRPLRIHVVGIEKEMNFLDLFKEVGFLLSEDLKVELVFIVREDMLPQKFQSQQSSFRVDLATNLVLHVVTGTYGDGLDPNFDCASGPPDMIVGLNAGLFAYESWRSVVTYLHCHRGVVGVFTDYNEHSAMNCASLGGAKARESLCVNPFRQPRAMPVYCMNLPQFSNGFLYVYNEQELDM